MSNLNYIEIVCYSWEEFLKYINGTYKSLQMQFNQEERGYFIFCIDDNILYTFYIWNYDVEISGVDKSVNNSNYTDFINNYKPLANRKVKKTIEVNDRGGFNEARSRTSIRGITLTTSNGVNPTVKEIIFPYEVSLSNGYTFADWDNFDKRDTYCIYFYPTNDGTIGTVTEDVLSGNDTVKVSSTVLSTILCGDFVLFDQLYEVYEKTSTSIVLDKDLTTNLSIDDPVKIRVPMAHNLNLLQNNQFIVTPKTFGSVSLTKNCTMRIEYHHYTTPTTSVDIKFNLVYFYGEK